MTRLKNQNRQFGLQAPRIGVVERQLGDLRGAPESVGGRGYVQLGQRAGRQLLEADMEFVGYRDFRRLHESAADYDHVAAVDGPAGRGGGPVEEPEAVGLLDRPIVAAVRRPDLGAGIEEGPDVRDENQGPAVRCEGQRQAEIRFGRAENRNRGREQKKKRPARRAQGRTVDVRRARAVRVQAAVHEVGPAAPPRSGISTRQISPPAR